MSSEIVLRAVQFAARKHHGQMRKDGKTPYVSHPYRVMFLLRHAFGVEDPEVLAAGVLHDTIEDTTADHDDLLERFGPRVAGYVSLLSKDKRLREEERELAYFAALKDSPVEVKVCKLADTLDNLLDSMELPPERRTRTIRKAEEILALFHADLPDPWRAALDRVREAIDAANA